MPTVASLLKQYEREHLATIATGAERGRQLRRILALHLGKPMARITQRDLMAALDGGGWGNATRNRYRAALTAFWGWGRERSHTSLHPKFSSRREESRDVTLSLDQLRALWKVAPARGDWKGFCRLLLLTGARKGEVEHMAASDVRDGVWRQPKTKNGTEHLVPLGPLALARTPPRGSHGSARRPSPT